MRWTLTTAMVLALAGCGGGDKDGPSSTAPLPGSPGDTACDTATTTCTPPVTKLNPVAVGFEIEAVIDVDGNFVDLRLDDGTLIPPILKLIFADEDFFGLALEQQEGHFCEIAMSLTGYSLAAGQAPFGTQSQNQSNTGITLNGSFELNFTEDITGLTACGPIIDEALWGPNAIDLISPFEGAHIGMGVSTMTTYLWDAFDGGYTAVQDAGTEKEFMGVYVAVNDRNGNWGGCDWSMTRIYAVDDYNTWIEDPDNPGYLLPLELDTVGQGLPPKGYMVNNAYWYQDFPLMDFTNLGSAPVSPNSSWLCENP